MVNFLEVKCPSCKQVCEIYLTSNASLVILNCPSCLKPIIYHKRKCLPLSHQQAKQIETANHESAIYDILQKIIRRGVTKKVVKALPKRQPAHVAAYSHAPGKQSISKDDITNLKIELATCIDTQTFINKM